ncbi:MAG TPA: hypothetical protein PKC85_01490 [Bacteroidia bacterium]|jgi:hypothetical protein|nr:hypothetical protein [Bacteroidia bacterium]
MLEQNATAILGFDETQTLLNEPYLYRFKQKSLWLRNYKSSANTLP